MLPRFHATSFGWLEWTGGSLTELGIQHNTLDIQSKRQLIRRYAVGYEAADDLPCRPKRNCVAVMFLKDEREFWTHMTREEFHAVFPELEPEVNRCD